MFSGRYTTIANVLETIYRNYGIEVPKGDAMEFVWEAIGVFGRPEILVTDVKDVNIVDYKGTLPVEVYTFLGCRDKTTKIPLLPSTGSYILFNGNSSTGYSSNSIITTYNKQYIDGILQDDVNNAFISVGYDLKDFIGSNDSSAYKYHIQNGSITVGIKDTVLEVAYLGFPVWEDGTPMIPEDPKVLRGIADYITEKVAFKMMLADKLSERKWKYIEEKTMWSTGSAINYLKIPTIDVMEGIKNHQFRIIPKGFMWNNGFETLNE